jgi:hypothetical protein
MPLAAFTGLVVFAFILLHFWTIRHMQEVINREVSRQSQGKFALRLGSTHVDYGTLTLVIEDAQLEIYDSMRRQETAGLEVPRISLHFKSIVRFLLRQELALDTVICEVPSLTLHPTRRKEESTLSSTLGKAALALRQAAENLNIGYLRIRQGKLTVRPSRAGLYAVRLGDLNVEVENFSADTTGDFRLLFTDDIRLTASRQRVVFADSLNVISFREIRLSTRQAGVQLDSCVIQGYRRGNLRSSYRFFFEQIRITSIDYGAMYERNFIKADSLVCSNPRLYLEISTDGTSTRSISEKLTEQTLKAVLGNLDVRYVGMENVRFDLVARRGKVVDSYSTHGNHVRLLGLFADQESERPVQVEQVAFQVANYRRLSPDSLYRESFDSVLISNRDLVLLNYQFVPSEFHRQKQKRWIQVPRLALRNIELSTLLFDRKVQAHTVDLRNPFIRLSGGSDAGANVFSALDTLRQRVGVKRAIISGGQLIMDAADDFGLRAGGMNAEIELDDLFRASTAEALEHSVTIVRCAQLVASGPSYSVQLLDAAYGRSRRTIQALEAQITSDRISGQVKGLSLGPFSHDGSGIQRVGRIAWESGNLTLISPDTVKSGFFPEVGELEFGNTSIVIDDIREGNYLSVNHLRVDSLQVSNGQLSRFMFRSTSGSSFSRRSQDSTWQVTGGKFDFRNNSPSYILNLRASARTGAGTFESAMPRLSFVPRVGTQLMLPDVDSVTIVSPKFILRLDSGRQIDGFPGGDKKMNASAIQITDLTLLVTKNKLDTLFFTDSGTASIRSLQAPDSLEGIRVDMASVMVKPAASTWLETQSGFTLSADELHRDSAGRWNLALEKAELETARVVGTLSNRQRIDLSGLSGRIGSTTLVLPLDEGFLERMINEPSLELAEAAVDLPLKGAQLRAEGLTFTNRTRTLAVTALRFRPDRNLEEFMNSEPYQVDYITVAGGPASLSGFSVSGFLKDSTFSAQRLDMVQPLFDVVRDKRKPREEGIFRPLPTSLTRKIPWKLDLDTLVIRDGVVRYTETSEKSGRTGTVVFANMDTRILNITNRQPRPTDSLRIDASALLMDSALIRINFRQAYVDTLGSFSFRVGMGPYALRGLNPVIEPLANIRITDGQANLLQLRAAGNDYYTLGKVKFHYQDLGVEFLPADPKGGSLFTGLTNFFTNSFVINRSNRKRDGVVYFERNRERSVFNYWLKITLSGILTSVGVKTNKSYIRNYRRNLRKYKLPGPLD